MLPGALDLETAARRGAALIMRLSGDGPGVISKPPMTTISLSYAKYSHVTIRDARASCAVAQAESDW
jgi:hypothetical protein